MGRISDFLEQPKTAGTSYVVQLHDGVVAENLVVAQRIQQDLDYLALSDVKICQTYTAHVVKKQLMEHPAYAGITVDRDVVEQANYYLAVNRLIIPKGYVIGIFETLPAGFPPGWDWLTVTEDRARAQADIQIKQAVLKIAEDNTKMLLEHVRQEIRKVTKDQADCAWAARNWLVKLVTSQCNFISRYMQTHSAAVGVAVVRERLEKLDVEFA